MSYWHSKPMKFRPMPVPFTRADLAARAITSYALQHDPRYRQVVRGVWIDLADETAAPTPVWAGHDWAQAATQLRAFLLRRPDVAGTLSTAARLYGLPLPNRIRDQTLHVAGDIAGVHVNRRDVVLHRHQHLKQIDFFDLPVVTIPHLFVELGTDLSLLELVQFGDAAVSKRFGGPKTTVESLHTELAARRQVRNRRKIEQACSLIRLTVDSPRETWLRLWLIDNGFPEPVVHPQVLCRIKNVILQPDMGYPELKLAIEYEGDHHRSSAGQFNTDIERQQLLEADGWTVIRVTKKTDMATFGKLLATHLNKTA